MSYSLNYKEEKVLLDFLKSFFFCRKSDIHLDIGTQVQLCGLRRSVVATGDGDGECRFLFVIMLQCFPLELDQMK